MLSITMKKTKQKQTPEQHKEALSKLFPNDKPGVVKHKGKKYGGSNWVHSLPQTVFTCSRSSNKEGCNFFWLSKKPIGDGYYGKVYPIDFIHNSDYKQCGFKFKNKTKVVKVIDLSKLAGDPEEAREAIENEIKFMQRAGGFKVKQPVFTKSECYVVMDRIEGADLIEHFNEYKISRLSMEKRKELIGALLRALHETVTSKNIIHRDIKPDNIIVSFDPEIKVKIIDFGFAIDAGKNDGLKWGTLVYAAPELLTDNYEAPSSKQDIYSLGRIIFLIILADNVHLFPKEHHVCFIKKKGQDAIAAYANKVGEKLSLPKQPELETLLKMMLHRDPAKRCTIEQAIDYFNEHILKPSLEKGKQSSVGFFAEKSQNDAQASSSGVFEDDKNKNASPDLLSAI